MSTKLRSALHSVGQSPMWSALLNLLLVYILMELTRLVFYWENRQIFHLTPDSFLLISKGGLLFDTSAILYLNVLWLAMVFLPLHLKERPWYWKAERWAYVVPNSLGLLLNLCDTAFFAYRQHRTTTAIFSEFGGEGNIAKVMLTEALAHWYLVLLFIAMVYLLWRLYRPASGALRPLRRYYIGRTLGLIFWVIVFIWGVRGCTLSKVTRPISIGYAQRFATEPVDVDLVLNTPFSMLRTIGGLPDESPAFFSPAELRSIYNPEHLPATHELAGALRGHNVVFIVLESFSQEFVGSLNPGLEDGTYHGYTPFLDSLLTRSVRFEHTFSNSGFSIDALPSLLASTPRMDRPFVVSPYSINRITGLGELLAAEGYNTAMFHGADNESLGLQAFARSAGFTRYYGIREYEADPSTAGHADFDGTWGIWDEPFLQYFAKKIGGNEIPQPFIAGVFTLSSHHPFDLPADRIDEFPPEKMDVCRLVRYTDDALRRFFDTAGRQPWFDNTLFIISADHAFLNAPAHEVYNNEMGKMKIPIMLYDPSGTLTPGVRPGIMQQIDVTPTLLGLLGYDKPYFAFGNDVFGITPDQSWGLRWNHIPQLVQGNYVLQLETESWTPVALYDYVADPYLRTNLLNTGLPQQQQLEQRLKAIIQTYSERQRANKVHL